MNALAYYVLRVSSITFHNLQYYEALVGTLKAANRKGLIKFKGQMLGSYLQVYEYFLCMSEDRQAVIKTEQYRISCRILKQLPMLGTSK